MAISTQVSSNEVLKATVESISLTVYSAGAAATLSSCTYRLLDSGGNVEASGLITPVSNVMTISIPATIFTDIENNCRVEWSFTVSSVKYVINSLFDVVSSKIFNCVVDQDLKDKYPHLSKELWSTQTNFSIQIEDAFKAVKTDIKNRGNYGRLLIDSEQIKPLIVHKALYTIFLPRSREQGDLWWNLQALHEKEYSKLFDSTHFVYDADSDAIVDQNRNFASIPVWR